LNTKEDILKNVHGMKTHTIVFFIASHGLYRLYHGHLPALTI